ncbi:hypothetical protein ACGFYT_07575 [Streptomyces sp. NPDC048208]|uniref:hypothetical protein n=1 Tax=Streptomyces sp. NPDC048208 TaxID=3365515 RepID=UPI0037126F0B
MKQEPLAVPAYAQTRDTTYTAVVVIESREEFAEYFVSHLRIKGQVQSLLAVACFSYSEQSAVDLAVPEPGSEHMSHVRFKPTLLGLESIRDGGGRVEAQLPGDSVRGRQFERRLPTDFLGETIDIP